MFWKLKQLLMWRDRNNTYETGRSFCSVGFSANLDVFLHVCFLFWNAVWEYIQPSFRYLWWFVFEFQNILSKIFYLENSLWILCCIIWFIAWNWTLNTQYDKSKIYLFHLAPGGSIYLAMLGLGLPGVVFGPIKQY